MKKNLYIDVHVLQTVPPSCVNRDDTGSPKTAIYGGTTRARVSSQAWKHAMRAMFKDEIFDVEKLGLRTKNVLEMVEKEIFAINPLADGKKLAKDVLTNAGVNIKSDKNKAEKAEALGIGQFRLLNKGQAGDLRCFGKWGVSRGLGRGPAPAEESALHGKHQQQRNRPLHVILHAFSSFAMAAS